MQGTWYEPDTGAPPPSGIDGIHGGEISLTATITNEGEFVSGEFLWKGAIPELGIEDGTILVRGEVTGFVLNNQDPDEPLRAVPIAFAIEAVETTGPFGGFSYLEVDPFFSPLRMSFDRSFEANPFSSSEIHMWSTDPVPEPTTVALFSLGVAGAAVTTLRRRGVRT